MLFVLLGLLGYMDGMGWDGTIVGLVEQRRIAQVGGRAWQHQRLQHLYSAQTVMP